MSKHNPRAIQARRERARRAASRQRLKVALFAIAGLLILGVSGFLVLSPLRALRAPAADQTAVAGEAHRMVVTMAGFDPPVLRVPAGKPFTVSLINPDSQFHTDGGGWHQFRIEALNVDVRIPPRSTRSQAFAGLAPGVYEFYCDVCCGGKSSPSMRGVMKVTG